MTRESQPKFFDRSDVLTAAERTVGYRVLVERCGRSIITGLFYGDDPNWMTRRRDDDAWVGKVSVSVGPEATPIAGEVFVENSDVAESHRGQGQGFGTLLYNLAIAYAYRDLGGRRVVGQDPSFSALGVHRKLAKLYGTRLRTKREDWGDGNQDSVLYSYPIKIAPRDRLRRSRPPRARHRRVPSHDV